MTLKKLVPIQHAWTCITIYKMGILYYVLLYSQMIQMIVQRNLIRFFFKKAAWKL